ncbi:peptidase M48 [Campylobacterota bacterium]|nr:peptidase M48 [Campylobacterota bacterium]
MNIFFLAIFALAVFVATLLSYLQIAFVRKNRLLPAQLLDDVAWKSAADYSMIKERISIVQSVATAVLLALWLWFGLSFLDHSLAIENSVLNAVVFIDVFLLINYLFSLPLDIYQQFVVDSKFGFNKSSKKLYITDQIKTLFLTLIISSIIVAFVAWFIASFAAWWLIAFVFLMVVIVLVNLLFPVIRAKMFDKFTPIDESELGQKIRLLLEQVGFKASGVFKVDAGKRDTRLNAYFAGLGSTKRVVLYDTLIDKLSTEEILAVLGHELGHFKHRDLIKNIAVIGVLLFALLALFGALDREFFAFFGLSNGSHNLIAMFLLFNPYLFFFAMPFFNAISRHNEFAADRFGAELADKTALKNALIKLVTENKSFPKKQPLYALFHETHPNILERIERLK